MLILMILSQIWKSGAKIERDTDGALKLLNHQKVSPEVLKAAEPIFDEIDAYLKSVEGMSNIDITVWKMIVTIANWQKNESINNFLCGDETALNLFFEYQAKLAVNGWNDIYADWREYENDETKLLKEQIFNRAVAFMQKGAK